MKNTANDTAKHGKTRQTTRQGFCYIYEETALNTANTAKNPHKTKYEFIFNAKLPCLPCCCASGVQHE